MVLAAAFALGLGAPAAAAERPNIVLVDAVEGLPASDSVAVHAFETALRAAFDRDFHLTEATSNGRSRVLPALASTFRSVHGDPFGDEWRVRVAVSLDSMPRLLVRVAILPPDASGSGAPPELVSEEFSLDAPPEPRAAWLSHAGRAAGLLAVEALHRRSGDLAPDTRIRIDSAVRRPVRSMPVGPGR